MALPVPPRLRLAFVGQSTFFEACALTDEAGGLRPRFFEFRKDADAAALLARLADFDPDVVVVFRPEVVPPGAFGTLRARTLGFLTEPLPRTQTGAVRHRDLERRLWELEQVDPSSFDRVISFDPSIADTAGRVLPVWRSLPLPVADRYFAPVPEGPARPSALFVGRSTEHRERLLELAKHHHELLHLAFGIGAGELERYLRAYDVAINLHNDSYPSFENRVCLHLAAGHLLLSEPLSPTHGLEPGIDFVPVTMAHELSGALERIGRFPGLWHSVRVRGRRKAEQFRASRVWPRLIGDFVADLRAFGSERRR